MAKLETLDTLIDIFETPQCVCGATKKMRHYFCMPCFNLLPSYAQRDLCRDTDLSTYTAAVELLERLRETQC